MKSLKKATGIFLCMALVLFVQADAFGAKKIRISSRLEFWTMTYVNGGFDKKYGLEADPIPFATGVEVAEAILGGALDIASIGHVPITSLLAKSDSVVIIGSTIQSRGAMYRLVVKKGSPYKTLDDLRGKRIATKIGSGSYVAFTRYLKAKGYKRKDFNILNAGPSAIIAAMEAGSVEGGIWFDPTISIMLYKGIGRVLMNFDGYTVGQGHWIANRKFAEKNPEVVARFLAGVIDAEELLSTNPKRAAQLVAKGYAARGRKMPVRVFEMGIPSMHYSPFVTQSQVDELKKTYKFLKAIGKIRGSRKPNWARAVDTSYLERAKRLRK